MRFSLGGLLFAVMLSCVAHGEVKVRNGDFERLDAKGCPENWYLPGKYRAARGEGSNGSVGLVYENRDDAEYYQNASQGLPLKPGRVYRFGTWVKVDEISGKGGVAIFMSWRDGNGKYLGETQTSLIKKPTDGWVKIEAISKQIPENAVTGSIAFVVQRGVLGRVAFDKTYAERYIRNPVVGVYCDAYRRESDAGTVNFAAALTPEAFANEKGVTAHFEVMHPDGGKRIFAAERPACDEARMSVDVANAFLPGTNRVACVLKNGDGREVGRKGMDFVRTSSLMERKVHIDRYGRTVVGGKLFFPLGMYSGQMDADKVKMFCEGSFNCLMQYSSPTSEQMSLFRKAGLKVIYDIASQYERADAGTNHVRRAIRKFANDPALLGWYLYDEKPTSLIPVLEDRYRLVEELDPNHPTWCAQDMFVETRHYLGACDVFGGDPYPVSTRPVSVATDAIREEVKGLMGMRPIWQVVQAFGWNWLSRSQTKRQRRPSEAEIRNMAWQALAGGARGLIFFNFGYYCRDMENRDPVEILWPEMKRISAEIKKYERILLFSETVPIPDSELPSGTVGRIFREGGEEWKLLVNTKNDKVDSLDLPPLGVRFDKNSRGEP